MGTSEAATDRVQDQRETVYGSGRGTKPRRFFERGGHADVFDTLFGLGRQAKGGPSSAIEGIRRDRRLSEPQKREVEFIENFRARTAQVAVGEP